METGEEYNNMDTMEDPMMNMMESDPIFPQEPVQQVTTFHSALGERPSNLGNPNVINRQTYDAMISCTELDKDTKSCTKQEWLRKDSPYQISEQSKNEQSNYKTYTRIRINIKER